MFVTAEDYYGLLLSLRPNGPAWPDQDLLLRGAAEEMARIHNRSLSLITEADPRSTTEMLSNWESQAGLPDPCSAAEATTSAARQAALISKITARGGQSKAYFIEIAAALGYTIAISEFRPRRYGRARFGELYQGIPWMHSWRVTSPLITYRQRRYGQSRHGEAYASWGNAMLECLISRLKPAHTHVIFSYI